ncbi:MAG TPA: Crp/Fnr family transcriptional regulator [Patescibacteria group bacterium]
MDDNVIKKLEEFFLKFPKYEYKKGEIIIQATGNPQGIFYIESGIVRRYYLSENGEEVTLNLYKPHAFLPMSWAIGNVTNTHFYEAMTPVVVNRAPREEVILFLKKEPDVVYDLLRRIYIGMEGLWMHLESLTAGNSYTKLVASLVVLAKRFGKKEENGLMVDLKMSERDLANYAGMSRETASRELQKLRKEKYVTFDKGIIIVHDIQKMEDLLLR